MIRSKKVLVTGGSGLVGKALIPALHAAGWNPIIASRRPIDAQTIVWDPHRHRLDPNSLHDIEAVVHLSGENIAGKRWNGPVKEIIRESRIASTRLVVETIKSAELKPRTFICASAIGIYGDTGTQVVDESAPTGAGFLADVCAEWEQTALELSGTSRVVCTRFGTILSARGGALQKMLPPFRLGVGGPIGSGRQLMSWVSITDVTRAILFALRDEQLHGPVNVVSPSPCTNREFTKTLGKILNRPTYFRLPRLAVSAIFGEMGETLLLGSCGVRPKRLLDAGFLFDHHDLESALQSALS